jgi:PIN domain
MTSDDTLPFLVFLDTEVYRSASFDWTRPTFTSLLERVERGSIELITTDIVLRELRNGLRALLGEFDQHVQKAARHSGVARSLDDERVKALLRLADNKPSFDAIWQRAEQFLDALSTTVVDVPESAVRDLFDLYFSGDAPFGSKKKKCEFPDAANLLALVAHARATGRTIHVVSADDDWDRTCVKQPALSYLKHLSEILDKAIRAEWTDDELRSDEELLELLRAKSKTLLPLMEFALESASKVNLGDGQIDALTVDQVTLDGLAITRICEKGKIMSFHGELFHFVEYTADVSIEDEDMLNTIEDTLSDSAELVASIEIDLPLDHPESIKIVSVDYDDGLNLRIPLEY